MNQSQDNGRGSRHSGSSSSRGGGYEDKRGGAGGYEDRRGGNFSGNSGFEVRRESGYGDRNSGNKVSLY